MHLSILPTVNYEHYLGVVAFYLTGDHLIYARKSSDNSFNQM